MRDEEALGYVARERFPLLFLGSDLQSGSLEGRPPTTDRDRQRCQPAGELLELRPLSLGNDDSPRLVVLEDVDSVAA